MSRRLALPTIVSESMIHIAEPVATQTLKYILNRLQLTDLVKHEIQVVSDFRDVSKATDQNHNPKLLDYRVVAKLNPSVNPSNNKWEGNKTTIDLGNGNTLVRGGDVHNRKRPWSGKDITSNEYSLFHDDDLFVDITEWNVGSTLTMEVKIDFQTLTPAQECLSNIFATFTNGDMIGYSPIQYDYPIPKDHQKLLKYYFGLSGREQTEDEFVKWLKERSAGRISFDVNRNNINSKEMVGLRNNFMSIFLIECTQDTPEVGQDRFTVTFNLTVQYSRTNRLVMDYPIISMNQLLPFDLVPVNPRIRTENKGLCQWQNMAVDVYWRKNYERTGIVTPIMYPWWDKWTVPGNSIILMDKFKPIFCSAVLLDDPDNPEGVTILDIEEGLPGYKLCDKVLEELHKSKSKALGTYKTYVNVAVFAHDYQVDPSLLEFDGRYLKLKSRRKEPIYRLVISLNTNPPGEVGSINWVWISTIIVKKEG